MSSTASPSGETAKIRERIETLAQELRAKNTDALMAYYAPDVVVFDFRPPHQIQSAQRYRKNFEAWFASVEGPIDYEIRDMRITAGDDVAFCHSLCHVKSTRTTGENADYWVRVTSGLQRRDGQWLITHEHVSAPIEMETMQAALGLQP